MEKKRSKRKPGKGKPSGKKPAGSSKAKAKPCALILSARIAAKPEDERAKRGRPTDYSEEIALSICERMVNGESLRSICRDSDMPDLSTVFRWKDKHPEFREQYAHAREMQAEVLAEEIVEIADTPMIGVRKKITPRGPELVEGDMVERAKLRIDARKWAASKILPKRYGDRPQDDSGKNKVNEQLEALAAAINAGPVAPGEVNPEVDEE